MLSNLNRPGRRQPRSLQFETLEDRRVLALLGIGAEIEMPISDYAFGASTYEFDADISAGILHIEAFPLTFESPDGWGFYDGTLTIMVNIDSAGNLLTAGDDENIFLLEGGLDVDDDGTIDIDDSPLLTGEVIAFGFLDSGPNPNDFFDFRIRITGGSLAVALADDFAVNSEIGVDHVSEGSSFSGSFIVDSFSGGAKGRFGPVPLEVPEPVKVPRIDIEKNTDGPTNANLVTPDFDNEDAPNGPGVPVFNPGAALTWTYRIKNSGEVTFASSDIVIVDDHGTPNTGDDLITTNSQIVLVGVVSGDGDALLEPGEVWEYRATGFADDLGNVANTYENRATVNVTGTSASDSDLSHYRNPAAPKINLEKSTNGPANANTTLPDFDNEDLPSDVGVPIFAPGDAVVWTYQVTNKGNVSFARSQITIVDDNGTPANAGDDFDTNLLIGFSGEVLGNSDTILDPGEIWQYTATGVAANLGNVVATYENKATITVPGASDSDLSHYKNPAAPKIDLEKSTNGPANTNTTVPDFDNEDLPSDVGVPIFAPGDAVVWTYQVTNKGNVSFARSQITIVDDNGTSANAGDDFDTNLLIGFSGEVLGNGDAILDPGEIWRYTATDVAANLGNVVASYENKATVTVPGASDSDLSHYKNPAAPKIDLEKSTNGPANGNATLPDFDNEDLPSGAGVPIFTPGDALVWTYQVTNNGNVSFARSQITIVDDHGTPANTGDDFDTNLLIGFSGEVLGNGDTILDPGEIWQYTAIGAAANLGNVVATYENKATVNVPGDSDSDLSHYKNTPRPGIDLEKKTTGTSNANPVAPDYDNEDAANGAGVPELVAGSSVTWTYKITNTGNVSFATNEIVVVDDHGTPGNSADDMSVSNGQITYTSGDDGDNLLEPGEVWYYTASGTVLNLSAPASPTMFDFSGSSSLDGTDGNIRAYTAGGISVKTSAFSRDKSTGAWSAAWLGAYSGGLGVTDSSEGDGSNDMHTVDNVGRDNYVLFEFSENVVLDSAFLGYVVDDSDLTIWIGTIPGAFGSHQTLSDALLTSLGFTEVNTTSSSSPRTANLNAGNVSGNVIVIAAKTGDSSPNDRFKIEKLTVGKLVEGIYENKATVTGPGGLSDSDLSHYVSHVAKPGIDIEKTTIGTPNANPIAANYDNEDTADGAGVPMLTPGSTVTWKYKVTNTGNVSFTRNEVVVTDDHGTPGNMLDDMSITNGQITYTSGDDGDNLLEPGEVWYYTASGTVLNLSAPASPTMFDFSGSSSLNGTDGNIRTYTAGGISVKTSAFSRDKSTGAWSAAWLGAYSGGLGVTDSSEGDGSNDMHTVDNVGRDNYVLFEFSENVVLDSAFLGYVVDDSDLTIWIGTISGAFGSHQTLSDALLTSLGFTEVNTTSSSSPRTANLNAGNVSGNVIVIAAKTGDSSPNDRFKIEKLTVGKLVEGIYENKATVTVPGGLSDSDLSHYKNLPAGSMSGQKFRDQTGNGLTSDDTPLNGITMKLYRDDGDGIRDSGDTLAGTQVTATVAGVTGYYSFNNLVVGTYFVEEVAPVGTIRTYPLFTDYQKVVVGAGTNAMDVDFANVESCDCNDVTNVYYKINGSGSYTTLHGNVNQGDVVTVYFTVPTGHAVQLSLVSYTAPDPYFDAARAGLQQVYEGQTGFFMPGTHSMTVDIPCWNFQIDFVCGAIIDELGPAGSNIFYTPQGRLISADNDGNNSAPTGDFYQGTTLIVGGSSANDNIQFNVAADPTKISVVINSQEVGQVSRGAGSGLPITRLGANGYDGADIIKVATDLSIAALLRGGNGADNLTGGAANDIILGEAGDDKIYGYLGRDLLIGGTGKDFIYGSGDDDILIGGTTAYDSKVGALDAIMKEWARNDTYANRVNHLKGSLSGGLNGSYKLIVDGTSRTVFDDDVQDTLYGEDGNDLFLINTDGDGGSPNDVVNKVSGEICLDID